MTRRKLPFNAVDFEGHRRARKQRSTDSFLLWAVLGVVAGGLLVAAALNREVVLEAMRDVVALIDEGSVPADAQTTRIAMPACGRGYNQSCVIDGDTIRLQNERIRLVGIDAPEISEPECRAELDLGLQARDRLAELLSSEPWRVAPEGTDRFGRTLAKLRLEGGWAGTVLVREGLAHWWEERRSWC